MSASRLKSAKLRNRHISQICGERTSRSLFFDAYRLYSENNARHMSWIFFNHRLSMLRFSFTIVFLCKQETKNGTRVSGILHSVCVFFFLFYEATLNWYCYNLFLLSLWFYSWMLYCVYFCRLFALVIFNLIFIHSYLLLILVNV